MAQYMHTSVRVSTYSPFKNLSDFPSGTSLNTFVQTVLFHANNAAKIVKIHHDRSPRRAVLFALQAKNRIFVQKRRSDVYE